MASSNSTASARSYDSGLAAGLLCYSLWGFLPLLFGALDAVDPLTIAADRTLWSVVVVAGVVAYSRQTAQMRAAFADPGVVLRLGFAALLLSGNWLLFIYAVQTGQLLEATLGQFINPLVSVALGRVLLGERQTPWQVVSIVIAIVAVTVQAVGLWGIPFISLGVAVSFALYGYVRKTVPVGPGVGLMTETLLLSPLALGFLVFTFFRDGSIGAHADPGTMALLMLMGPATAGPLLLFAFAVKRLRLATIGMLQYIPPSISFILAVTVFGEHLNEVRLVSFALIWLSLMIYTTDSVVRARRAVAAG